MLVWVVINHADDYGITEVSKDRQPNNCSQASGLSREATIAYDSDPYWSHRIITM